MDKEFIKNQILYSNGVINSNNYFTQVPNSFVRNENLTHYEKLLYIYIWGYGGDRRGSYPSHSLMVKHLGFSKSTIKRTLKSLEDKNGLYIINRVKKKTKEKSTNVYYLAEIDLNTGAFVKESLDIVRQLYPNKIIYI